MRLSFLGIKAQAQCCNNEEYDFYHIIQRRIIVLEVGLGLVSYFKYFNTNTNNSIQKVFNYIYTNTLQKCFNIKEIDYTGIQLIMKNI